MNLRSFDEFLDNLPMHSVRRLRPSLFALALTFTITLPASWAQQARAAHPVPQPRRSRSEDSGPNRAAVAAARAAAAVRLVNTALDEGEANEREDAAAALLPLAQITAMTCLLAAASNGTAVAPACREWSAGGRPFVFLAVASVLAVLLPMATILG